MRYIFLLILCFSLLSCKSDDENIPITDYTDKTQPAIDESPEIISIEIPETYATDFKKDTVKYLALGDSYTIGTGVVESERWPNLLAEEIKKSIANMENPEIIAGAGWTTGNLLKILDYRNLQSQYHLVSLLIGVNNQYTGSRFDIFKIEFIELLTYSMQKARSRDGVFVLSIPDYGVTPFGSHNKSNISEEIDMYNEWIQETCKANKIKYYDITELSRLAESDLSLLTTDELHPSSKMYAEWIKQIIQNPPDILKQ